MALTLLVLAILPRAPLAQTAPGQGAALSPGVVRLVVERAPTAQDCPDAAALADRVSRHLGRLALDPSPSASGGPTLEVQVLRADDGYTAIVLSSGRSRQISDPGPGCAGLGDALAVTIAILLDIDTPPTVELPPPPPAATITALPTVVPPPTAAPLPPPPPPPRVTIAALFAGAEGLIGSFTPGLHLEADARVVGPLSIAVAWAWLPEKRFSLPPGAVDVSLMFGSARVCLGSRPFQGAMRDLRIGACGELDVGGLNGRGVGFFTNRSVVRPWVGVGLTGVLDVPIVSPFFWSTRISAVYAVTQESFSVDGVGVAFQAAPVGLLVATGVGVRIF